MTEEGLAVYNDEENKVNTKHELKTYAARVLAIHWSLKGGFREAFNELCKYVSQDAAWKLVVRAKRGLSDTSLPGAFTKDILYLKGHLAVRNYVRNGGNMEALYYGKVGIHDVEYLKDIPGLLHPRFMPLFQYFDFFLKALESKLLLDIKFITRPLLTPFELTRDGLKRILGKI